MIQNHKIKYNLKVSKNSDITNQRRQNIKNMYTQFKRNIKTTYSQNKQRNRLDIMTKKKLTENLNKKNDSNNINLIFNKKSEESRNTNKAKLEKNIDEEVFNGENDIFFNKTEKDIKLLYNKNYSKKSFKNISKPNLRLKSKEKETLNKQSYYYTNKEANDIKDKRNINNNFLLHNKKMNSNKDLNPINITNKNKFKENNENNKKQDSSEKISKLMINKKLISKDEFIKSKNLFEKLNSARLSNNENNKFILNLNKELNSDIKTISNKNTSRINSQKLVDLKEKELNLDKIKKIKKNKIIKQIKIYGKKNHSMTMNDSNKILFLNETIKETIKKIKPKEKNNVVNLYNFPSVKNNIPRHKNHIMDGAEPENSENNIKNDLSVLNCTCFNFNETNINNSTLNNNLNRTLNKNGSKKRTPNKCHYHNNSFSNLYNQVNFYSKPVARLKKRILDPPSDKKNDNSMNNKINEFILDKSDAKDNDSLEIDKNENNNSMIKEFLITIKVLNQIINTQKKIIEEHLLNEYKLKKEIEKKENEMKNYKNICMKLMFFIKEEKEINILNEKNKKRQILENQLLKENEILKQIIKVPTLNIDKQIDNNKETTDDLDITCKKFYKSNINENTSTFNFYKTNIQKNKDNALQNENNIIDPLYNIEITNNPILSKKREKSYENRKNKKSDKIS